MTFGSTQIGHLELVFADALDCFFDSIDLDLVFLAIFPAVVVLLVKLDRIDVTGSSVNDAKS